MLSDELRSLGVAPGSVVMVHASMRAVGVRAEALVEALRAALGESGTLMAYVDFEPTSQAPRFDLLRSPAAFDYGILAEVIRRDPRAVRSDNPGASVSAIGARARWLCDAHPLNYGYGPGSPLAKLAELDASVGGSVLLLGSDPDQVTLLHFAEHMARLPHKRVVRHTIATVDGDRDIEEFDTNRPIVAGMPEDYFAEVTRAFIAGGGARRGRVGGAESYLLPARRFVDFAVAKMEREYGT